MWTFLSQHKQQRKAQLFSVVRDDVIYVFSHDNFVVGGETDVSN